MAKSIYSREQLALQALLRQVRIDAALRQEQLAAKLKRPQSFVSKYESGERRLDLVEIREICGAIGIPLPKFVSKFEDSLK